MSAPGPTDPRAAATVQAKLHELAQVLRQAHHLGHETQESLADLVEELSNALNAAALPAADSAHLAESATELTRAVHKTHDTSRWAGARDRLEQAALRAEASAPIAAGVLRRLIDTLADLGI